MTDLGSAEIAQSLRESHAPQIMINLPSGEDMYTKPSGRSCHDITRMSTSLWQDATMGTTYIDSVTTSMSPISMGPASMVGDCPMATLKDVTDIEN